MSSGRVRQRWGIGQVLVSLVLVTLAPFILLEVYRGVQDVRRARASVAERALGQVEEEAETMTDFVRFTDRYLSTLAMDPTVRALDQPRMDAFFRSVRELNPNYINVFLLTPDGEQIASTEPLVTDPQIAERPYFREAMVTGALAISSAVTWPESSVSAVVFARRVDGLDGTPVAVLCAALNLARLSTVIGFVSLPSGSVVLLTQRNGMVIAASETPEAWVGSSIAGSPLLEQAWDTRRGTTTATLSDGKPRIVGYELVSGSPWLLVAGVPRAEAEAVMTKRLRDVAAQTALAGAATILLAWIVLRRVVVPIQMLSDGARSFAAGFLNRRVPLQRNDELGQLADSLNTMAASLARRIEEEAAHARALEDLNRLQAEFVATASHELRTPVTAIRTYAEALLRPEIADPQTRRECLEGIDRASERLARLARSLLDVSRIDRDRVPVTLVPVRVDAAIAAAADAAAGEEHAIVLDLAPDLPPALADADRLVDVLANLIGNACKFSPPGTPVTVRCRTAGADVLIRVEDEGPGIPVAERERIFDRFYQVERGADRQASGSGLGLYIVRGYVVAMGGRVWVEERTGGGSAFVVALPIETGSGQRAAGNGEPAAGGDDRTGEPASSVSRVARFPLTRR